MKYILTHKNLNGKILVEFTGEGILYKMEVHPEDATKKFMNWFLSRLPLHEAAMNPKVYDNLLKIEPVSQDLGFDTFWKSYAYKVGNKKRAQRLWEAMTDPERAKAIAAIRKYKLYLASKPNMEQAYPETWLSQRRWENEYK